MVEKWAVLSVEKREYESALRVELSALLWVEGCWWGLEWLLEQV
jgi:hypothetical protein